MAGATLQPIYDRLNGVPQYHPGSAETFADWTLEAGDIVRLKRKGQNYDTPVMVNTMRWNGLAKSTMEFDGQKERKAVSKVSKQKYGAGGGGLKASKDLYRLEQNFDDLSGDFTQFVVGPTGIINSALWQGRDHVTAVAGDIEIVEDPTTHTKTMVVKSGGGIKVRRNNVEYGLYDNGNLTAGVIVNKINGGTTRIVGKNVIIDGDTQINGSAIATALGGQTIGCGSLTVEGQSDIGYAEAYVLHSYTDVSAAGDISAYGDLYTGGNKVNLLDASVNTSTNTLTITKADGTTVNFRKAASPTLTGTWSGTHLTISSDPAAVSSLNYYFGHNWEYDANDANLLHCKEYWKPSAYSSVENVFDDGTYNVKPRYNAGWTAAYNKVSLPGVSASSAFSIQTPGPTVDGSAITTAYAINDPVIDGSNSYIQVKNSGQQVVAQKSIGNVYTSGYNAGKASVHPIISASWSGGVLTISSTPSPQANVYEYLGKGTVTWNGVTGTVPITAAPSSGAAGSVVYTATVTAPFHKVNDSSGRQTFTAYYYNNSGSLESMGSHAWYYHT